MHIKGLSRPHVAPRLVQVGLFSFYAARRFPVRIWIPPSPNQLQNHPAPHFSHGADHPWLVARLSLTAPFLPGSDHPDHQERRRQDGCPRRGGQAGDVSQRVRHPCQGRSPSLPLPTPSSDPSPLAPPPPLVLQIDAAEGKSPGWKFNYWEMKGVPVRCSSRLRPRQRLFPITSTFFCPSSPFRYADPESIASSLRPIPSFPPFFPPLPGPPLLSKCISSLIGCQGGNSHTSPLTRHSDWLPPQVRIEVGPKDVANSTCVVARRDRPGKEGKQVRKGGGGQSCGVAAHFLGRLTRLSVPHSSASRWRRTRLSATSTGCWTTSKTPC